jgi:hypothetical protein
MRRRWTPEDLATVQARMSTPLPMVNNSARKYHNEPIVFQGMKFDSKHELKAWQDLELQRVAGALRAVIRQVSMPLQGSSQRIRVDFLVIDSEGRHRWLDAKGFETQAWRGKRNQVFDTYGITIELI